MLHVLPPMFKAVLQQIMLRQVVRILTSDWIIYKNFMQEFAIPRGYVICCKTSLAWASKMHNMY